MKLYRLPFLLHEPTGSGEGKYMAEVPFLPGCRAWGDSAAEALENLQAFVNIPYDAAGLIDNPNRVERSSNQKKGTGRRKSRTKHRSGRKG